MRGVWLAVMAAPVAALAGPTSPAQLPLQGKPAPLLCGQIELSIPVDMVDEPVTANSLGPCWNDHQRFALQLDDVRLVMAVYETYGTIGADFKKGIAADLKTQGENLKGATIRNLSVTKPLVASEVLPKIPKASFDANNIIYVAYVGNPNATVEVLAFYLPPGALPHAEAWIALARRISSSVVVGKDPITGAGVASRFVFLDGKAGDPRRTRLVVTTPEGWTGSRSSTSTGLTFDLRKLVPLGTEGPSCSFHQDYTQPRADTIPSNAVAVPGNLLGDTVRWSEWSDSNGTFTQVSAPPAERYPWLEISCHAKNNVEIIELRRMVETLRVRAEP